MEKPIQPMACGPENVTIFRRAFREAMGDEGQALLRALFEAGMVEGMRGVRIGPPGGLQRHGEASVCPVLPDAAEARLADLRWNREQGGKA